MTVHAELKISVHGTAVIAEVKLINQDPQGLFFVAKTKFPLPDNVTNKLFVVETEGKPVAYTGRIVKREPAGTDGYFKLGPEQHIEGAADLQRLYQFLPGTHEYTVRYKAYYGDPRDPEKLNLVESNTVTFTMQR